jgi:small subunit ribosomal protein S18
MPKSRAKPRAPKRGRPFDPARRRYCSFCKEKVDEVDYRDVPTLRRFVSERGKIKSRRISGACRRHQRQVAVAIKRAREMALLPYVAAVTGGEDGRGRRRRG